MTVVDTIRIAAPPLIVWQTTIDVERWPDWAPAIRSVRLLDGSLEVGSRAEVIQWGMPATEWRVSRLDPGRRFVWETTLPGMRMVASHDIVGAGRDTENVLRLEAHGASASVLKPLLWPASRVALRIENRGLRTACERMAG